MDQVRVETFLDEGWGLIDQLHRWLSNWPMMSYDRGALAELIRGLQQLWTAADDLGLTQLSRTILALEQILERFCARTLAFTGERLEDVTTGIEGLHDLLLGFEATREEPPISNLDAVVRMEQHTRQTDRPDEQLLQMLDTSWPGDFTGSSIRELIPVPIDSSERDHQPNSELASVDRPLKRISVQRSQFDQLERLTASLAIACHRLHASVVADQAPYQPTTTRLNHLTDATSELVGQIVQQSNPQDVTDLSTTSTFSPYFISPEIPFHEQAIGSEPSWATLPVNMVSPEPTLIVENPMEQAESESSDAMSISRRVLVIEESLFYRHLMAIAVRTAGFEAVTADSVDGAVDLLEQPTDFCAILVGTAATPGMDQVLDRCRSQNVKIIGLVDSDTETTATNPDATVSKLHPQEVILALESFFPMMMSVERLIA